MKAKTLATIVKRIENDKISGKAAKEVLDALMSDISESTEGISANIKDGQDIAFIKAVKNQDVDAMIEILGLEQVSDDGALLAIIDAILAANEDKVNEYKSGKDKLFGFFVGQTMKESKGSANPAKVNDLLKQRLS
jgi:aspartyl-tRNA(Asn)/glutamyl-tRNA(Gln) amidotransferase subunit B